MQGRRHVEPWAVLAFSLGATLWVAGCGPDQRPTQDGGLPDAGPGYPTGPFTPQGEVPVINMDGYWDTSPHLRDDGLEIFFGSERPESAGDLNFDSNIWVSTRASTSDSWSAPTLVAPLVTAGHEGLPVLSDDGLTIYFIRNGVGVMQATRSDAGSQGWVGVAAVDTLNVGLTRAHDLQVASDGSEEMVVVSDRAGSVGSLDFWFASRAGPTSSWTVTHGGADLNSAEFETGATLSVDLRTLYLASARDGVYDRIYRATRASPDDLFGTPVLVDELVPAVSTTITMQPHLTPDGLTLYYVHTPSGSFAKIHFATRTQ